MKECIPATHVSILDLRSMKTRYDYFAKIKTV